MNLTGNQKILILGVVVVVILYLVYMQKEGADSVSVVASPNGSSNASSNSESTSQAETKSVESSLSSVVIKEDNTLEKSDSDKILLQKMTSKNSSVDGEYKKISYATGNRDSSSKNLDDFFEQGTPLNSTDNTNFLPNDVSASHASYSASSPRKELNDDDKFNASALLPQEEKQDWFEDVTPQKIKNRHLINIYRPIGVNTVITSRKNGSLDLRGNPVNPKTFVSPFLNSSIEPDVNARGICT